MPTIHNASTTRITSRIKSVTMILPLVHAKRKTDAMIPSARQHTQGNPPMKDGTARQHHTRRLGSVRLATLALLPLALASTAQTSVTSSTSGTQLAALGTTPFAGTPADDTTVQASRQVAYVPPPRNTVPLAPGFDVHQFETIAQALVANQRVPGLALAIVKDGRILTARGYGITDVRAAEPVDAHTVFRLASLSKAFAGTLTGLLVSEGALRW